MIRVLKFNQIQFTHPGAAEPLFDKLELSFAAGWTGIVGANGCGKSTLLRLALGDLDPDRGSILRPAHGVVCAQSCETLSPEVRAFLASLKPKACTLRGQLGIEPDWGERWQSLSYGERKRMQIACALSFEPEVLALDEPTNHLDSDARELLITALLRFRGIGLLVSHDRELLDRLCEHCLFINPPRAELRIGNYSAGQSQEQKTRQALARQRDIQTKEASRLAREIQRRREVASRTASRMSAGGLDRKDHDMRAKLNLARHSSKDACAHQLVAQLERRGTRLQDACEEISIEKTYEVGIGLSGRRSHRQVLLKCEPFELELSGGRRIQYPAITIASADRIGITGANGTGKTTTVRHLLEMFADTTVPYLHLPQELAGIEQEQLQRDFRSLSNMERGRVLSFVSCLGTRPGRLLASNNPSPGELRKLFLGFGMLQEPNVVVLDEPTNHLDLPAIEALEEALSCIDCALIVVTHDRHLLGKVTYKEWHLTRNGDRTVFHMTSLS